MRFVITSKQKEYDGSIDTQKFERVLDYIWDAVGKGQITTTEAKRLLGLVESLKEALVLQMTPGF